MSETPESPATAPTAEAATEIERVFMIGSMRLQDVARNLPPLESLRLYVPNYPYLAMSTLSAPEVKGNQWIFHVEKPPVTTKG